jgi:MarR family transcriptional regulator for hemolysin
MNLSDRKKRQMDFAPRLNRIGQGIRRAIDEDLRALGLTDATWRPLFHLGRLGDGLRQKDLAEALMIEGPSLVPLLDNLELSGLVERIEDPSDRRCKLIHMTTAGEKVYRQTMEIAGKISARVMRNVTDDELVLCHDVFDRLELALDGLKAGDRRPVDRKAARRAGE